MTADALPRFGLAEAKDRLSALTASANKTGLPFIITKSKKPWVEVRPLAVKEPPAGAVTITPMGREVVVADIDEVFAGYEGSFIAREDGFASAVARSLRSPESLPKSIFGFFIRFTLFGHSARRPFQHMKAGMPIILRLSGSNYSSPHNCPRSGQRQKRGGGRKQHFRGPVHPQARPRFREVRVAGGWGHPTRLFRVFAARGRCCGWILHFPEGSRWRFRRSAPGGNPRFHP